MDRIVVGVDGSASSDAALRWALEEGRLRDAAVEVVHCWLPPVVGAHVPVAVDPAPFQEAAERALDAMLLGVDRDGGDPKVVGRVVCGGPAPSLVAASEDADLVVVGSRGLGGFAGLLLGSVSQQVLHHARCPVVVVHHPTP